MGDRTMAKNQSKNKSRLSELIVLLFVIVTATLLMVQMGMNVVEFVQ